MKPITLHSMKHLGSVVLGALSLLMAGCAERIIDYVPPASSTDERKSQESGIEVTVDPFVEQARTKKYFDIDAVGKGIAILHIGVANKTTNRTFLVSKGNLQLFQNGSDRAISGGTNIKRPSAAEQLPPFLIGAVTAPVASAMISSATEVQRNFTSKEMGDQTLSPGESMEGFVYFAPVPHNVDWSRAAAVKAKLIDTKTQQSVELNIPLTQ